VDSGPTETVMDPITTTPDPQPERTCAILVSGKGEDETEQNAFNFDVELIRGNLMREKFGPKLSDDDVVVMENPSVEEVEEKLAELKDQYSKIYFYYSGHGGQSGLDIGEGSGMLFLDLRDLLYDSNAPNLCVVIDACNSGGAGRRFKKDSRWEERNITLVTASDSVKPAKTITLADTGEGTGIRGGAFTYQFALGFGNPAADADGNGETSLEETFNWVRGQNPELRDGRMNDEMNPQICTNEVIEDVSEPVILAPSAGVTITPTEAFDSGASVRVEMRSGVSSLETEDPAVLEVSPGRTWSFEGYNQSSTLDFKLQFRYQPGLDFAVEDDEVPGLAKIVFGTDKRTVVGWVAHSPTVWDPENQTITADHVTEFGDWVIAKTTLGSAVAVEDEVPAAIDGMLAPNYPNPFRGSTTIRYTVSRSDFVEVTVVDLLGRTVARLVNERKEPGEYSVIWNGTSESGREVSAGVYVYRLRAGSAQEGRVMVVGG